MTLTLVLGNGLEVCMRVLLHQRPYQESEGKVSHNKHLSHASCWTAQMIFCLMSHTFATGTASNLFHTDAYIVCNCD